VSIGDRLIGSVFCFYLVTFWLCQYISLVPLPPIGSLCWLIGSLVSSVWCSARRIRLNLIINVESVVRFVRNFQFGPFGRSVRSHCHFVWSTAILLCLGLWGITLFSFVLATAKTFCVIMYRCSRRRGRCHLQMGNIFVRSSDHSFRVFCWALVRVCCVLLSPSLCRLPILCPCRLSPSPSFSSLSLFAVVVLCYVCALC